MTFYFSFIMGVSIENCSTREWFHVAVFPCLCCPFSLYLPHAHAHTIFIVLQRIYFFNLRHCNVINAEISLSILANVHWTVIMLILFFCFNFSPIFLSLFLSLSEQICAQNTTCYAFFFDQSKTKWNMTVINLIVFFCVENGWKKTLLKKRVHTVYVL